MIKTTSCSRRLAPSPWLLVGTFLWACSIAATALAQPATGVISTIAGDGTAGYLGDGTPATTARINYATSVAVDAAGNVYIADQNNHRIRKVTAATGVITTFAGSGVAGFLGDGGLATSARLYSPQGVALDAAGNLYIADHFNYRIRKVTAATGIISTVAGSGTAGFGGDGGAATAAQLNRPTGVAVGSSGDLYIADQYNHRIRGVSAATGVITTLAGSGTAGYDGDGGLAPAAKLYYPTGVAVDGGGNVYIADLYNHRVRKVTAATGLITTAAGTGTAGFLGESGPAFSARLYYPIGVATDGAGNVYIADQYNHRIRRLNASTGTLTTVAGSGTGIFGGDGGDATAAQLQYPAGVAVAGTGILYIADEYNQRIRKVGVPAPTLQMTTLAGNGTAGYDGDGGAASAARLYYPHGVAVDGVGNAYIADVYNHRIRKVTAATGLITTVAGTGIAGFLGEAGPATLARLYFPSGIAVDGAGNLYIADQYNHRIRKVTAATGVITTVAGSGTGGFAGDGGPATTAQLQYPVGVAVDGAGNLFIADWYNHRVRKVTAATGVISTLAGDGTAGYLGDGTPATTARLNSPKGTAVDGAGNVFIADTNNNRVRKVAAATGVITTIAGTGLAGFDGESLVGTSARLYAPNGVAVDGSGNVYIADFYNNRIRKVTVATGVITTVAGSGNLGFDGDGGAATAAVLYYPSGVAVGPGGHVYIADQYNHRIRKAAPPLTAPSGLTAVATNATTVRLNWTAASGAASYSIKRGTISGGETLIASGVAPTSYIDAGLATNTTYYYVVSAVSSGAESPNSNEASIRLSSFVVGDFDSDRKTDMTIFRPSSGHWFILKSSTNSTTWDVHQWGGGGDVPVPGDYDGDGKTDVTVYRPSSGHWFILKSSTNYVTSEVYQWGSTGDVALPGDFDGDGKADITVYRPSSGHWFIRKSSTNYTAWDVYQWGGGADVPVPGDYDGDGKTDVAVYRKSSGHWFILKSSTNFTTWDVYQWGGAGDTPLWGDFDGDGKADVTVYRPSSGHWFILKSSTSYTVFSVYQWGGTGDIPVPADYDGDGKADITVYRPSSGHWFILKSSTSYTTSETHQWGAPGDIPAVGVR